MRAHAFSHTVGTSTYGFADLKDLLARASPARSGDLLAGLAADTDKERVVATSDLQWDTTKHCQSCAADVKKNRRNTKETKKSLK